MEVVLARNGLCQLRYEGYYTNEGTLVKWGYLKISNLLNDVEAGEKTLGIVDKLEEQLLKQPKGEEKQNLMEPLDTKVDFEVKCKIDALGNPDPTLPSKLMIEDSCDGILKRIVTICGGVENLVLNAKVYFGTRNSKMQIEIKDAVLDLYREGYYSVTTNFMLTQSLVNNWTDGVPFHCRVRMGLNLSNLAVNRIYMSSLGIGQELNQKMLEDAGQSGDVTIVAGNGAKFKCHKVFLRVHADVFKAMFSSGMTESSSNEVKMEDVDATSVSAFLSFIYCGDIMGALLNPMVAVDLMILADKYGMEPLLEAMHGLIMDKEDEWLGKSCAEKLLPLLNSKVGIGDYEGITEKVNMIMQIEFK